MENTALVLIVITLFLLVIIVGLLTALIYKLLKQGTFSNSSTLKTENETALQTEKPDFHPVILERMKELEKLKARKQDLFCPNHPDEPGEVTCAICDKLYCKACVRPFKTMHFCKEHLPLIMRHDWEEILTLKTSTSDPEQGVKLYDIKKRLFENENITTYIETHYKINVDQDYIETYLVLFGIKEEVGSLKEKFSQIQIH